MITVAVGGNNNLKAFQLFGFRGKPQSNFVCFFGCNLFSNRKRLHKMIEQSAVLFAVQLFGITKLCLGTGWGTVNTADKFLSV